MSTKTFEKTLDALLELYATNKTIVKEAKKIVDNCIAILKEDGRASFKGKKYTVVRKETEALIFDKDAFILDYGQAVYDIYKKPGIRTEFVIVKN